MGRQPLSEDLARHRRASVRRCLMPLICGLLALVVVQVPSGAQAELHITHSTQATAGDATPAVTPSARNAVIFEVSQDSNYSWLQRRDTSYFEVVRSELDSQRYETVPIIGNNPPRGASLADGGAPEALTRFQDALESAKGGVLLLDTHGNTKAMLVYQFSDRQASQLGRVALEDQGWEYGTDFVILHNPSPWDPFASARRPELGVTYAGLLRLLPVGSLEGAFVFFDACEAGPLVDAFLHAGAHQVYAYNAASLGHPDDAAPFFGYLTAAFPKGSANAIGFESHLTDYALSYCVRSGKCGGAELIPSDNTMSLNPALRSVAPKVSDSVRLETTTRITVTFDTAMNGGGTNGVLTANGCGVKSLSDVKWSRTGDATTKLTAAVTPKYAGELSLTVHWEHAVSAGSKAGLDGNYAGAVSDYGKIAAKDGPSSKPTDYAWRVRCGAPMITGIKFTVSNATASWNAAQLPSTCSNPVATSNLSWSATMSGLSVPLPSEAIGIPRGADPQSTPGASSPTLSYSPASGSSGSTESSPPNPRGFAGTATWSGSGQARLCGFSATPKTFPMWLNGQEPGPKVWVLKNPGTGPPTWTVWVSLANDPAWLGKSGIGTLPLGPCEHANGGPPCAYDTFSLSKVVIGLSGKSRPIEANVGPAIATITAPDLTDGGGRFNQAYEGTITITGDGIGPVGRNGSGSIA